MCHIAALTLIGHTQELKDLQKAPLEFTVSEADKRLEDRSWAVTSPHLGNTNSFRLGLGKAKTGLIWGDCSVGFETSTAFTLYVTEDEKMEKGSTRLVVSGLTWDDDEQLYKGQATFYGKTFRHCALKVLPMSDVKLRIWLTHPFQGALHSISGNIIDVFENEDCTFLRREHSFVGYVRTFTTVETIRALEQVKSLWQEGELRVRAELMRRRNLVTQLPNDAYRQDLETSSDRLGRELSKRSDTISDVDWALKFGGRVRLLDGNEQQCKRRGGLNEVDSTLFNLTGQLMSDALNLTNLVTSLKAQNGALEAILNTGGVGISAEATGDGMVVSRTISGSAAELGGIKPGDVITAINGLSTEGMTVQRAGELIRGPADSTVRLDIRSGSGKEVRTVTLIRKRIRKSAP